MVLTCGAHTSARGKGVRVPVRGGGFLGRGLVSEAGPNGSPGPFILFRFLFSFSFSILFFLNLS
jgi:hypothetical protein